jgi:hypothetical protein
MKLDIYGDEKTADFYLKKYSDPLQKELAVLLSMIYF